MPDTWIDSTALILTGCRYTTRLTSAPFSHGNRKPTTIANWLSQRLQATSALFTREPKTNDYRLGRQYCCLTQNLCPFSVPNNSLHVCSLSIQEWESTSFSKTTSEGSVSQNSLHYQQLSIAALWNKQLESITCKSDTVVLPNLNYAQGMQCCKSKLICARTSLESCSEIYCIRVYYEEPSGTQVDVESLLLGEEFISNGPGVD